MTAGIGHEPQQKPEHGQYQQQGNNDDDPGNQKPKSALKLFVHRMVFLESRLSI
jgi:hypothetical protein